MGIISEYEQRQITYDCFNQNIPRDCRTCPASNLKGGICCFGDIGSFDEADSDCEKCVFATECREEIIDQEAERMGRETWQSRYEPPRRRRTTQFRRGKVNLAKSRPREERLRRPRDTIITPVEPEDERDDVGQHETMFIRFLKEAVWGALQGALEMAAEFVRGHRLP